MKWKRARDTVLATYSWCQVPGCLHPDEPMDRDGDPNGPLYATVHHTLAASWTKDMLPEVREDLLADPRHLIPAHRECNSALQDRPTPSNEPLHSRDWGL